VDVLDGLASLVDKSLLRQQEERGSGAPRFYMLGTIREYASEKLEESGEVSPPDGVRRPARSSGPSMEYLRDVLQVGGSASAYCGRPAVR